MNGPSPGEQIIVLAAESSAQPDCPIGLELIAQIRRSYPQVVVAWDLPGLQKLAICGAAGAARTVMVIGPDVARAAIAARKAHALFPDCYVLFAPRPDRVAQLQRELAYAAPGGGNWALEVASSKDFAQRIATALLVLAQQGKLRTPLDRINLSLSPAPAQDAGAYRRLVAADRYLASILTHTADAIMSLDLRGTVVAWSAAATRIFGIAESKALNQPLAALLASTVPVRAMLEQTMRGEVARHEFEWVAGSTRNLEATFSPVRDASQRLIGIAAIVRDVSEQRQAERTVRESELRLRSILDRAPVVIFMKDKHGRYQFVNAELLRVFGMHSDAVLGKTVAEIFPAETARALRANDDRVWSTQTALAAEETVPQHDGPHTYLMQKFLLRELSGEPYALCGIAADITERLRIEQSLRDTDRRKDEFLATLAHELRNPLAPIRNAIALVKSLDIPNPQVRWSHGVIERQALHLSRLLDDLLEISRLTRGKIELRSAPVDLPSILGAAIETARPLIEGRRHTLTVSMPEETLVVQADPDRLAQVFANLLNNAAKFTPQGGRIGVRCWRDDDSVALSVRDNGIGIAASMRERIFEIFAQADVTVDRSEGGLGIGLALVRGLVALHGGSVLCRSEGIGHGSEFIVRLPGLSSTLAAKPAFVSSCAPSHSGLKVLVADDNEDSLATLEMLLTLSGHQVQTARNGRQAVELANAIRPQAAVLDIGMPALNGYEVARHLRAKPWGRDLLLIAATGFGQEKDKLEAAAAGFDHHLTKPLDLDRLASLLRSAGKAKCPSDL